MAQVIAVIKAVAVIFGNALIGTFGPILQAVAFAALDAGLRAVLKRNQNFDKDLGSRDVSIRSASANAKIIYGQALVGGVLRFSNVEGSENENLWRSDIMAGHECEDITDVWLDGDAIESANINWGTDGKVTSGKYANYVWLYKKLGTATQTVNSVMDGVFPEITTNHAAKGRCLLEAKFQWVEASNSIWDQTGAPRDLKGLVKGKNDIYDPRLDISPGNDPGNASYQAYTDNPVLCLADYLTDSRLGMGIAASRIDWQFVKDEANYCDVLVPLVGGSEKRFTCNGVLSTGTNHRENILTLLSSFNGRLSFRGTKWIIRAGRFGEGANLCSNPTFDSNISGWAEGDVSDGSISHNADAIKLTNGASGHKTAVTSVSVVEGATYTARAITKSSSNEASNYGLAVTYNADGQTGKIDSHTTTEEDAELRITWKATSTGTVYLSLYVNSATNTETAEFDDVEVYKVTDINIDADWLAGDVAMSGSPPKSGRYNRVDALYISPTEQYKPTEALPILSSEYLSRDNGELLINELTLSMTNSETQAQRLSFKHLNKSDKSKTFSLPCNYKAIRTAPHDYASFSLDVLGLTDQLIRIQNYGLSDLGDAQGVGLIALEDDADTYADPNGSQYSSRTAAGTITFATSVVYPPTGFAVSSKQGGNLLSWTNPSLSSAFDVVEILAHTSNARSGASKIYEGRADSFLHKLEAGETYYYWIRAKLDNLTSDYVPDTETTTITATAALVASTAIADSAITKNKISSISLSVQAPGPITWTTADDSTYSPSATVIDAPVVFNGAAGEVARRTIRFTRTGNNIAWTNHSSSGFASTAALTGGANNSSLVVVEVTETASGIKGTASASVLSSTGAGK